MAGKRYSAGTIFLQVSPVFRRFQEDVQDYVKDIDRALGDDMEKSGRRAGERAGKAMGEGMSKEAQKSSNDYAGHFETSIKRFVRNAEKEIGRLDLSTASKKMLDDLDVAKRKLRELNDQDFNVDFNSKEVIADLGKVKAAVEGITKGDHDLNIDSNVRKVVSEIEAALKFVDAEVAKKRSLDIDTDTAERKMGAFERKIKSTMERAASHIDGSVNEKVRDLRDELIRLSKLRVGVEISATRLHAEAKTIMRELREIENSDVDIEARFNAGKAYAEMKAFDKAIDHVDGRVIRVRATANTAAAQRSLFGVARSGDDAANSFRSFNAIIWVVAGAGPALIPILGGIAAGLLAIGPAAMVAVAGLGAVLVGFSGIGDAVGALNDREDARAATVRDLGKATKTAARAEADGARRVADARRSAARQIESALDAQRNAQERYRDSVEDVREAELALANARRSAQGTGREIKEKISDNALGQDQALLDVFNATVRDQGVQSDGSATNAEKEQSRIDLENARDALDDLRKEGKKLAAEQKKWQKDGVNGTDEVKSAQENLNDAIDAQKEAYRDLGDAARDVERARADGARQVADAMRQSKRAIDDANAAMGDMSTEQEKVADAFSKLGPAGKRFARFLQGLREGFYRFRNDIQKVLLPQIEEAMAGFLGSSNSSVLRRALINLADSFGGVAKALSLSFQGPAWGAFFTMLADLGPDIQAAYGQAFIYFLEALASILTTLAPYALEFAEGFSDLMESFAGWAASEEGAAGLERFMDHMKEIGPDVLRFIGVLALALTNVLIALAPYSELILKLITDFLDLLANMDTEVLGGILSGIIILIASSQTAYAVMNLLLAGGALLRSSVGLLIFSFVGLALAIYWVYTQNETLGKVLAVVVGGIYALIIVMKIWRATAALVAAVQIGLAAASYGAAGATYAQAGAARAAYLVARTFAAAQWLAVAAMNGSLLAMIRMNAAMALMIAKQAAISVATKLWAGAQWLLNVAMSANPLALVLIAILALGAGLVWAYRKFEGFRKVVDAVIGFVKRAFFSLWDFLFGHSVMPDIIDGMVWFFEKIKAIFGWVNEKAIKPLVKAFTWMWEKGIQPVFDFIVEKALPKFKNAFQGAIDGIKKIWEGLKKVVAAPIKFVLETIINKGLIAGFNKVASWVNMDGVKPIPIPSSLQSYAAGGVMPGYTPGRDPHKFVSPTGGRLELSGGEAVMRPEWTAAMGPDYVHQMNALARQGGVGAIRNAMSGAYFMGGILPVSGAGYSSHGNAYGHPAYDLNYGGGYDDYGRAIKAWKDGIVAQMNYIGDSSYGRWAVLNHGAESTLYAHMSAFAKGLSVGDRVRGGQTIGAVGDLGNTGTPPTSHLHFEIMNGLSGFASAGANASGFGGNIEGEKKRKIPSWLMSVVKNPLGAVKDWVTSGYDKASDLVGDSPVFDYVKKMPLKAAQKVTDKVWGMVPGWVKSAAGWVADGADWVAGGVKNAVSAKEGDATAYQEVYRDGGILPYNGTMKYDSGGYLPPGLTSVVNLTGKPEPVFTNDQWSGMGEGKGGNIHYEPHFEGSDLTASDVAGDLNFAFRKIRRAGKYEGVGR